MAYGVGYGVSVDTDLACAPGEMITYWDQTNLGVSRTVISAGPVAGDVLTYATSTTESASVPSEWSMTTETIEADFMVVAMAVVGWNVKYPTTSPTSRSATSADPVRTTSSSTSVPSDTPSSDDLSSGAKAGIGVGVAVGVIGILALLGAIFLIRRKRKNQASSGGGDDSQWNKHELPTTEAPRAELSEGRTGEPLGGYYKDDRATDRAPVELAAEERPQEMYTDHE
ncbi:MAG: hypothetical protein M1820_005733 [Bogoriella megaspora]|nr:MAG: hypothetical protein M1820_005733 [Bogoriella megaspora]